MDAPAEPFSVETMRLGGFMTRQWYNDLHGGKFRKQVMRRAARTGGASRSIEIRDECGFMVDYYMCDHEYDACGSLTDAEFAEMDRRLTEQGR